MRILMANTYHYLRGGDSAYALGISEALKERGHTVIAFAMQSSQNLPSKYSEYFVPELDYPAMQAQGGVGNAWRVASNSVYNRDARRCIARLLDDHPVDVVHLHSVMHHLTASIVLEARSRKIPIVWTLHDAKACCPTTHFMRDGAPCHECAGGRFNRALQHRCKRGSLPASAIVTLELYLHRMWKIYEQADLLITPSRFLGDTLRGAGLEARRMEVLPNFAVAMPPSENSADAGTLLYVGRLSPEKGVDTLVHAVQECPQIQLKIAGDGEQRADLEALVRKQGITNVEFLGHVDRQQLEVLLGAALAVVLPSNCDENCPLVILEAFAAGRAVLASGRGGIPELVVDGVNGHLVGEGGVTDWREALGELSSHPEVWRAMGARAKEIARERFSMARHLDALEGYYGEVVTGRTTGVGTR